MVKETSRGWRKVRQVLGQKQQQLLASHASHLEGSKKEGSCARGPRLQRCGQKDRRTKGIYIVYIIYTMPVPLLGLFLLLYFEDPPHFFGA